MNYFEITENNSKKMAKIENDTNLVEEQTKWLARFRLFLTFVQHKPSILCLCMNKNAEKIKLCNEILHSASEISLWLNFCFVLSKEVFKKPF